MDRRVRGTALIAIGVVLCVGTVVVGATTAPSIGGANTSEQVRTLVGSQGEGSYHSGGSVYLLENGERVWTVEAADSYFDVTMRADGTVLAAFMQSGYEEGCGPYGPPCTKTGYQVIDPDSEDGSPVVEEHAFPVRTKPDSEVHDVEELPGGEVLVADMEYERLYTVADGQRTWSWNASSFYDAPPDPTRRDWLHINDVDVIAADRYLVSVRNANQLLVVERGSGVVEVVNRDETDGDDDSCRVLNDELLDADGDGDIRCGDPAVLKHQHNPQWLADGAVLVSDSDNDRVVELHRNETTSEWEPVWSMERAGGVRFTWPRDADRLPNGNTLVTDSRNGRLLEVTHNRSVVWSHKTSGIPYEAERLPEGERVGGRTYTGSVSGPSDHVPLLSPGMVVLRSLVPATPYWFTEPHLGAVLLGVLVTLVGALDRLRS